MSKKRRLRRDIRPEEHWSPKGRNDEHTAFTIDTCRKYDASGKLWYGLKEKQEAWLLFGKRLSITCMFILLLALGMLCWPNTKRVGMILVGPPVIAGILWRRIYRLRKSKADEMWHLYGKYGLQIRQMGLTMVYDSTSWYEEVEEGSEDSTEPNKSDAGYGK